MDKEKMNAEVLENTAGELTGEDAEVSEEDVGWYEATMETRFGT